MNPDMDETTTIPVVPADPPAPAGIPDISTLPDIGPVTALPDTGLAGTLPDAGPEISPATLVDLSPPPDVGPSPVFDAGTPSATQEWLTQVLPAIPAASVPPDPAYQPTPSRPPVQPDGHPVALSCPECGAIGSVDPTRRDAADFCPHCDFPLFWAKDRIPIGAPADAGDDSLRRLPGALGRVVIASVPCPHCNELNLPTAAYCVRCGSSMQPVPMPPPPPPAPVRLPAPAPPPPPPAAEKERLWIWWVLLITVFLLAATGLILAQHWY